MFLLIPILVCFASISSANSISCREERGNSVDWFVAYKLPASFKYVYLTPDLDDWKLSTESITSGGAMLHIYEAMFNLKNADSAMYGMYNDEVPGNETRANSSSWGHTKGALAFDQLSGLWVIHSIPKLSEDVNHYRYPSSGKTYGQHVLCVTLNSSYMQPVVDQLLIAKPQFLSSYISNDWKTRYPEISVLFQGGRFTRVNNRTHPFETLNGGLRMRHFSKSAHFNNDLYEKLVAPYLGLGLKVESWRHGQSEPSVCNGNVSWVMNVKSLAFKHPSVSFSAYKDHAKWATTMGKGDEVGSDMWTCLGDINRMFSQFHRGGGTMCVNSPVIWRAFSTLITSVEPCSFG